MEWYERWIYLPSKLLSILSGHTAPLSSWCVAGSVMSSFKAHSAESTEIDIICIHSMIILSRRFVWQRGLKISAHKFLPCFLLTACLKMIRSNCVFLMHCSMAFMKQVFPNFLNPRSDIVELRAELLWSVSFQAWTFHPAKWPNFAPKLTYKLFINLSTYSLVPSAFDRDVN